MLLCVGIKGFNFSICSLAQSSLLSSTLARTYLEYRPISIIHLLPLSKVLSQMDSGLVLAVIKNRAVAVARSQIHQLFALLHFEIAVIQAFTNWIITLFVFKTLLDLSFHCVVSLIITKHVSYLSLCTITCIKVMRSLHKVVVVLRIIALPCSLKLVFLL